MVRRTGVWMLALLATGCCARIYDRPVGMAPPGPPPQAAPPQAPGASLRERLGAQTEALTVVAGQDFEVWMKLPAGASIERRSTLTIVRNDPDFVVELQRGGPDTTAMRQQVVASAGPRLRGFLVDVPAALMYETAQGPDGKGGGFHVYVAMADDRGRVTCRSSDDVPFTLEQAEAMLLACNSMTMAEK